MNRKRIQILVVNDKPVTIGLLAELLSALDYNILIANDGQEAIRQIIETKPGLVVLDVDIENGFEVFRKIRTLSEIPIIILSSHSNYYDRVKCLEIGADDYITIPFNNLELSARIKAVLRRYPISGWSDQVKKISTRISQGELYIDIEARKVTLGNKEIFLTNTEFLLLTELVINAGRVISHNELLVTIWGPEYERATTYIYMYIRFLREKIEIDSHHPQHIINIPRVGYRFDAFL
jgi:two-component system, OmpR family, KDP operon response regulator KdpE